MKKIIFGICFSVISSVAFASPSRDVTVLLDASKCESNGNVTNCSQVQPDQFSGQIPVDSNNPFGSLHASLKMDEYIVQVDMSLGHTSEGLQNFETTVLVQDSNKETVNGIGRAYLILPNGIGPGSRVYLQFPEFSTSSKKFWGQVVVTVN